MHPEATHVFATHDDGVVLHLDLYQQHTRPAPLILFLHGGGYVGCDRGCIDPRLFERLIGAGYRIASADYRLLPDHPFPAQLDDSRAALAWLKANLGTEIAPRVGAWGISAGAHLAALLGVQGDVDAVCDHYGPIDLAEMAAAHPAPEAAQVLFGAAPGAADRARLADVIAQVGPQSAPFLILHGTHDAQVPAVHSKRLHQALSRAGIQSKLMLLDGVAHDLPDSLVDPVAREMIAFFDRQLRR